MINNRLISREIDLISEDNIGFVKETYFVASLRLNPEVEILSSYQTDWYLFYNFHLDRRFLT